MFKIYWNKIINLIIIIFQKTKDAIKYMATSSPKTMLWILFAFVVLYYPLGGAWLENIDKNTQYKQEIKAHKGSKTIQSMSFLIKRETSEYVWASNLPLIFPSYFLDNMPNYQTGIIKTIAQTANSLKNQITCPDATKEQKKISKAAKLLAYPPNIWLFSPNSKLKIAPSSVSQYRKAQKELKDTNHNIAQDICIWDKSANNLSSSILSLSSGLSKAYLDIESQIYEGGSSIVDTKADNLFYNAQGQAYGAIIMLKSLGEDYKELLVEKNIYQDWTVAINALQNAVDLSPIIVKNGDVSSQFATNHLIALAYYLAKTEVVLIKISNQLIESN